MAFSPLRSKAHHRGLSFSLPSEFHPSMFHFDENLSRIRASEAATCSPLLSMNERINSLKNVYESTDDLLQLPHNQQIISQDQKRIDQLLDGCTSAKDLISQTKQDKKVKEDDPKVIENLRSKQNVLPFEKDDEEMDIICMLKDTESVTITMIESLLPYVMGTKVQSRQSGWSLVSKLIHSKKVSDQIEDIDFNEFKNVDSFLQLSQEDEELMNHLKKIDWSIQILEEELDCLFRQLIKTRVFLLNIVNH
ncbi:hypothetical protein BUALT_Bualt15G0002000 [Buddleja alternifolia]|uniref:DUF4378 domain-containing protein n=1 Tax=Buddleja alternifolia TaxID=168488 RepID=A0AAV6WHX2_9LAMI|nr:hypothetical protein BUALT_Bualt15G0002000 [Buddleja alternifolia]